MSIYLDLIEQFSEKIIKQLFLISSSGVANQSFQDNSQKIIENLKGVLLKLKDEKSENEKVEDELRELESELFKLQIQSEHINKKFQNSKNRTNELKSEINTLKDSYNKLDKSLNESKEDLETIKSKLKTMETNLSAKESEKEVLEQNRSENEEKYKSTLSAHSRELDEFKIKNENNLKEFDQVGLNQINEIREKWSKKLEEAENLFNEFKRNNFFTLFLLEDSDEKIQELKIITILMEKQNSNLDDLKRQIDLPPILAVRTIKQMEVKGLLKVDEESNIVSLSEEVFNI
ncbi:MAG: hypothetical protein ACFE8M_11870 [Candidatus Hermodarchaeota archaeon]